MLRRFRLVLYSYIVFATAVVVGVWVNYAQQQEIKNTQAAIVRSTTALVRRDCAVVASTATVFVDFIRKEIELRAVRGQDPKVSAAVRAFDQAEVEFWTKVTLPALARVYASHCDELKVGTK